LFGDTNVVQIKNVSTGYQVESIVKGDTISAVLEHVQYDSKDLLTTMTSQTELALENQQITPEEAQKLLLNYASTLNSYTYLNI
jgi:arginine decarboxylase